MTSEEGFAELRKTRSFALIPALIGAGCFVAFIISSAPMRDLMARFDLADPLKLLQFAINYTAKYFLTTVVISDLFLRILQGVRVRELTNPMRDELARRREARLDQLLTMTETIHDPSTR